MNVQKISSVFLCLRIIILGYMGHIPDEMNKIAHMTPKIKKN